MIEGLAAPKTRIAHCTNTKGKTNDCDTQLTAADSYIGFVHDTAHPKIYVNFTFSDQRTIEPGAVEPFFQFEAAESVIGAIRVEKPS